MRAYLSRYSNNFRFLERIFFSGFIDKIFTHSSTYLLILHTDTVTRPRPPPQNCTSRKKQDKCTPIRSVHCLQRKQTYGSQSYRLPKKTQIFRYFTFTIWQIVISLVVMLEFKKNSIPGLKKNNYLV